MSYLPNESEILYLVDSNISGISGYKDLQKSPMTAGSEVVVTKTISSSDGEVLLEEFVSPAIGKDIVAGDFRFYIYGSVSVTDGVSDILGYLYKRTSAGTETELFNFSTDEIESTDAHLYDVTYSSTDTIDLDETDRLVLKLYAETDYAGSVDISFYYHGTENQSRMFLPITLPVISGGDMVASLYDSDLDGVISGGGSAGNWILLADSLLASDAANIDFASISGSYKHLMLIYSLRSDYAANNDALKVAVNNDTGNNYDIVRFSMGHDKNAATAESYGTSPPNTVAISGNTSTANYFAQGIIYFNDYANTGIYKPFNVKGGTLFAASAGLMYIRESFGVWRSTNAINRLTFAPVNGSNFKQYSRISLYGLS